MTNVILGLCDPPEPIYLYVSQGEASGQSYLWYRYDVESQQQYPVFQRGLLGYLVELRITQKEYKGKENYKLDVVMRCDRTYIIRSGLETNFSKTLLLALDTLTDFSCQPLTVAVAPGEENVVFGRLYASSGQRIKADWNPDADWLGIVSRIQEQLGQAVQAPPKPPKPQPQPQPQTKPQSKALYPQHNSLIKSIRAFTGHTSEQIVGWCRQYGASQPSELSPELCDRLIESLCVGWGKQFFPSEQHAANSFRGHVQSRVAAGAGSFDAIASWIEATRAVPAPVR